MSAVGSFTYYQCETCGTSLKGPKIKIHHNPYYKGQSPMQMAVPFPFPVKGCFSSETGLSIVYSGKIVILDKNKINYCITFPKGELPQIIEQPHKCPKILSIEEIASGMENGEMYFPNANRSDVFKAMGLCRNVIPTPPLSPRIAPPPLLRQSGIVPPSIEADDDEIKE